MSPIKINAVLFANQLKKSLEAYRDELAKDDKYLERSNIEAAIAPYDEATGYPRKWRK